MCICRTLIASSWLVAAASAAERPDDLSTLLADAPADPLGVAYVARPGEVLGNPLLRWWLKENAAPPVGDAARALGDLFDGPTAVVVAGPLLRPDLLAVTLTARVSKDEDAFFEALDCGLVAALNRIEAVPWGGAIGFDRSADTATVRLPGPLPVHITFAYRDGIVRASTNRATVTDWLSPPAHSSNDRPKGFLESEDAKRLMADGPAPPDLLLYLNARPLMPLAQMELLRNAPELSEVLALNQFQAFGITAAWSGRQTGLGVTVCLAGPPRGLLALLDPGQAPIEVSRIMSGDTVGLVGGSFGRAAGVFARLNGLLEAVDADIVREYEEERVEFQRDFGFDIQGDFLANLTGEWAVGVRTSRAGLPELTLALGLADAGVFEGQHQALVSAFDLKFDVTAYRGVLIYAPKSARLNFAYGVVDDYLVAGPDAHALRHTVDALRDGTSLDRVASYRAASKGFSRSTAAFGFLDVSRITALALAADEIQPDPALGIDDAMIGRMEKLASGTAAAGFSLRLMPGRLRLAAEVPGGREAGALVAHAFWASMSASLARSRELSRRLVSAAKLRGIVRAARVYERNHGGEWPGSLAELAKTGHISLDLLASPYDGTGPRTLADADRESFYLYRRDIPKDVDPREVVAGEPELRSDEGANFAYADGHVEFVREPEAGRLLAMLRARAR